MTPDDIAQLQATLTKIRQAIQNQQGNLDLLRDISTAEELAHHEADLARLRQKESDLVARLDGAGALAQQGGIAAAALGDKSIAIGKIGHDLIVNNHVEWLFVQIIVNQAADPDPAELRLRELKQRYLENLGRDCDVLRLADMGGQQGVGRQVRLSQVYIGLNTTATTPVETKGRQSAGMPGRDERPVSALEAAAQNQYLALVGDPGSGKSTFVRQLTAWLALAHLGDEKALEPLAGWTAGDWPFLLNLRELAPALAAIKTAHQAAEVIDRQLVAAIEAGWLAQLERLGGPELAARLADVLARERLLLVFDGLDEVAEPLRPRVRQAINALQQAPHLRLSRIIVTSRVRSYTEQVALPGFARYTLAEFDRQQVNDFIGGWYRVQGQLNGWDEAKIATQTADLQRAAGQDQHLFELAQNPLLLTVMAIIHQQQVRLPPQRVQLYSRAVQLLLAGWQEHKGLPVSGALQTLLNDTAKLRTILQHLAYAAHQRQSQAADRKQRRQPSTLSRPDIVRLIDEKQLLPLGLIDEFLEYVDQRAGLLRGLGGNLADNRPNAYDFPHRTFQEYLAGCRLVTGSDHAVKQEYWARAAEGDYWAVSAQYGAETLLHSDLPQRERLLELAYDLCRPALPTSQAGWRAALWSGQMAAQLGVATIEADRHGDPPPGPDYLRRLTPRLVSIVQDNRLRAVERAEAGRLLAVLGDPRPGVRLRPDGLPDIAWCTVPTGKFIRGSKDDGLNFLGKETPQQTIELPAFQIGRYPITNAQYTAFVSDGGYSQRNYWREAEQAGYWRDGQVRRRVYVDSELRDEWGTAPYDFGPPFHLANHPVVGVNWWEAVAYCAWLTERLRAVGQIDRRQTVSLPTESQWEKAARGEDGQTYPWGPDSDPERGNYTDTGIGTTSAVGCFPGGVSPCEALDMSGNVWEWCLTKLEDSYQKYKDDNDKQGNILRVLRGGAFDVDAQYMRCAARSGYVPYGGLNHIGFRVMLSPFFE